MQLKAKKRRKAAMTMRARTSQRTQLSQALL
jgi:hypothetical protein